MQKPSAEAWRALGPYAKTRLTVHALGLSLALDVPGDVFSTLRIDEGTQLLLGHLPARPPRSLLDLGCGYGALGLPVAARFPEARALLVDRDLLAVAASAHNARALGLGNVKVRPSLGYRDVPAEARFDWILCNVPARIGGEAIGVFLARGQARLTSSPDAELRMVAIRDLVSTVLEQAAKRGLAIRTVATGPRHSVFALGAAPEAAASPDAASSPRGGNLPDARSATGPAEPEEFEALYARDRTLLPLSEAPLSLERPHDASEDPGHAAALSVLFEALPRAAPGSALAFRCGFGGVALALRARFPACPVTAVERDLLDAAFLQRNARALGLASLLTVRTALFPAEACGAEKFALVAGELSPSAGPDVAVRELAEARGLLAPGGHALALATVKQRLATLGRCPGWSVLLERKTVSLWRAAPATAVPRG